MGTITIKGANFATRGSISKSTNALIIEVEITHQENKFNIYFKPDLE